MGKIHDEYLNNNGNLAEVFIEIVNDTKLHDFFGSSMILKIGDLVKNYGGGSIADIFFRNSRLNRPLIFTEIDEEYVPVLIRTLEIILSDDSHHVYDVLEKMLETYTTAGSNRLKLFLSASMTALIPVGMVIIRLIWPKESP